MFSDVLHLSFFSNILHQTASGKKFSNPEFDKLKYFLLLASKNTSVGVAQTFAV